MLTSISKVAIRAGPSTGRLVAKAVVGRYGGGIIRSLSTKMADAGDADAGIAEAVVEAIAEALPTHNEAKLRGILKTYYKSNFNREVPETYFKNIVAQADENSDGVVECAELKRLLKRIGHDKLSDLEIEGCINELGGMDGNVPTPKLLDLLLHPEDGGDQMHPEAHPLHPLNPEHSQSAHPRTAGTF